MSQLLIIFQEESEILVRYINLCVSAILLMLLLSVTPTRERILVYLKKKLILLQVVWNNSELLKYFPTLTLFFMSLGESVRKMEEVGSEADILDCGPCRAGKNVEWMIAGLEKPSRGAISRVILK